MLPHPQEAGVAVPGFWFSSHRRLDNPLTTGHFPVDQPSRSVRVFIVKYTEE
jgi:hypothetical protein